jgi:16S rRNA (guanine1207-N2)-methyltransferase
MSLLKKLETYHQLHSLGSSFYQKAGMRLLPNVVWQLFSSALTFHINHFVDVTGGKFALNVLQTKRAKEVVIVESSRATLRALQKSFERSPDVNLLAGALWDVPKSRADVVFFLPQTDKGNARVEADFVGACNSLRLDGEAFFVMHKDQGAKRYEKLAETLFGEVEVLDKEDGWRLCKAIRRVEKMYEIEKHLFSVLDLKLQAEPGVYAAGKLDPGTAFLLQTYDMTTLAGKKVLDLGCGYGPLSLKAALADAAVTALDDDLLAVRSTHVNAEHYGLDIRTLHSDVNSELHDDERFDVVITNPPFHLGKQVILDIPEAFIAAAYKHLVPGGELFLVANKALAYQNLLEHFAYWETLAISQSFKVLRAIR